MVVDEEMETGEVYTVHVEQVGTVPSVVKWMLSVALSPSSWMV
jgi:hypothetical protein